MECEKKFWGRLQESLFTENHGVMVCVHCYNKYPKWAEAPGGAWVSLSQSVSCSCHLQVIHIHTAHSCAWIHRSTQSIHCLCCHLQHSQEHEKHSPVLLLLSKSLGSWLWSVGIYAYAYKCVFINSLCLDPQPLKFAKPSNLGCKYTQNCWPDYWPPYLQPGLVFFQFLVYSSLPATAAWLKFSLLMHLKPCTGP